MVKEKKQFNPRLMRFHIVFTIIWQIYLVIRFICGDTQSPLYLLHVVLAIILDIKVVQLLVQWHKIKKKDTLSRASRKWNKMWELWAYGEIESPYRELMTYKAEVCNGGHGQYFENVGNLGDLQKEMAVLDQILPPELRENLKTAYETHLLFESDVCDDSVAETDSRCDMFFYENEEAVDQILKAYAATIKL